MFQNQKEEYLNCTEIHPLLPLFFQPWWLDMACVDWNIALWKNNEQIKAVFPYQIEKKLSLQLFRNPLLTPYLGPYFLEKKDSYAAQITMESEGLTALLKQITPFDSFQVETIPEFQNFPLMHSFGFSNTAKRTYFIDLENNETVLFSKIHSRRRNYIRKAEKELDVIVDPHPDIALFHQWHQRSFSQKEQRYPFSLSYLEKVIATTEKNKSGVFLTANDKTGNPVAMLWTPFDEQKFYHLLGAYDSNNKINGAMDLLVWTAIKKAKEMGKKIYDFEGSMEPGIASFFQKFGGVSQTYFSFIQTNSKIWKLKRAVLG